MQTVLQPKPKSLWKVYNFMQILQIVFFLLLLFQ